MTGRGHTEASKRKMSAGQKRRIRTPEELARMSAVARQRVMTPEYREKLRLAAIERWKDPAQRAMLSATNKGRVPSALCLERAAAAKRTPEFRAACADRARSIWAVRSSSK